MTVRGLHLMTLWGFAVAQPLFDLIGRYPAFLTAHQLGRPEILILSGVLALALPALLLCVPAVIGLLGETAARVTHLGLVAILSLGVLLVGIWRIAPSPEPMAVSLAAAAALAFTFAYQRFAPVRSFVTVLSPAVVIFPVLFLLTSPAARLFDGPVSLEIPPTSGKKLPNIVFMVFDELPTTVLMQTNGEIDAQNFPGFAALAHTATWYRNATTVHTRTEHALPAILTGKLPKLDRVRIPAVSEFPHNLFTWAAPFYRVRASEPMTDLCPARVCGEDIGLGRPKHRTRRVLRDLAIVYLHTVLPPSVRDRLPPINRAWADFGEPQFDLHEKVTVLNNRGRHRQIERFIDALTTAGEPTFYFMHANLPHAPYEYLPGGERYVMHARMRGLQPGKKLDTWGSEATALYDAYRRFHAQARYVDKILADVVVHLRRRGLYDESLFIVTADHGVSIRADDLRRGFSDANRRDIAGVPLFVKLPGQTTGRIVDDNVEVIDIMPTIAAAVGVPLTWKSEGVPMPPDPAAKRDRKTLIDGQQVWSLPSDLMLAAPDKSFAAPDPPVDPDTVSNAIGRPVGEFDVRPAVGIEARVRRASLFSDVDFQVYLPAHVVIDIDAGGRNLDDAIIVIAVNGIIGAVTRAYVESAGFGASYLLPASAFRSGRNSMAVYWMPAPETAPHTLAELVRIE